MISHFLTIRPLSRSWQADRSGGEGQGKTGMARVPSLHEVSRRVLCLGRRDDHVLHRHSVPVVRKLVAVVLDQPG